MHVCVNTIMGILEKTYYIILNLDFIHFYYVIYGGGGHMKLFTALINIFCWITAGFFFEEVYNYTTITSAQLSINAVPFAHFCHVIIQLGGNFG